MCQSAERLNSESFANEPIPRIGNRQTLLRFVRRRPDYLEAADAHLQQDPAFVLMLAQINPEVLRYLPASLRREWFGNVDLQHPELLAVAVGRLRALCAAVEQRAVDGT